MAKKRPAARKNRSNKPSPSTSKKNHHKKSNLLKVALIAGSAIVLFFTLLGGYFILFEDSNLSTKQAKEELNKKEESITSFTKKLSNSLKEDINTLKEEAAQLTELTLPKENSENKSASHEYAHASKELLSPSKERKPVQKMFSKKAKLAIIIDDVSFSHDVRNIHSLNMPLTMAFLPPSDRHPHSAALAAKEPFYMVHLPLEASGYYKEEPGTLKTDDSLSQINNRIEEIIKLFPHVRYINNHTGSKFTADEQATNKLINVLIRKQIVFVDSRTTAKTKVPKLMEHYNRPYIARDVFLDHKNDIDYIKNQIKIAVKTAKKHGTAIAIGHPHKNTLRALAESKEVLEEVELVRIDHL